MQATISLPTSTTANTVVAGRSLICTIDHVLSPAECEQMIGKSEAWGYEAAPITTAAGFVMRPDIRNNTRVMRDDEGLAAWLWQRLQPHLPACWPPRVPPDWHDAWRAAGLNERFRFYRYDPGQRFAWHFDGAFARSWTERSMLTIMVYLNDDFDGGTTDFENGVSITPVRGRALIFAHAQSHQGAPPTRGRKYVLRTDVMYQRAV